MGGACLLVNLLPTLPDQSCWVNYTHLARRGRKEWLIPQGRIPPYKVPFYEGTPKGPMLRVSCASPSYSKMEMAFRTTGA